MATGVCDGVDNNCDGSVDEDSSSDATTWYLDSDGDGYGDSSSTYAASVTLSGYGRNKHDCEDRWAAIHPEATEVCDGVRNNGYDSSDEDSSSHAPTC